MFDLAFVKIQDIYKMVGQLAKEQLAIFFSPDDISTRIVISIIGYTKIEEVGFCFD